MGNPAAHPALALPEEIVVRPVPERYRRRWLISASALAAVAVGCLVVAVVTDDGAITAGIILAGVILAGVAIPALRWQRDTFRDPEPALVLQRQQFRVRHQGRHLWVPWSDVASVEVLRRGVGLGRTQILLFDLAPHARAKLPPGRASLADRMFSWKTNDLTYDRPCDMPPFDEVAVAAVQLRDHATGGHEFRATRHTLGP